MTTRSAARALAAAAIFLSAAAPARAYQRDEHYYTVRLTLGKRDGGEVAALCSQLADESPELNAIAVYKRLMEHPLDYLDWSVLGDGPDETVGRMVTVQQILHGLTGGSPLAVRAIAVETARALYADARKERDPVKRADALCALGFSLHLYGDTFAHQRIKNSRRMYETGIGHFYDATRPDVPLYSPARFALWRSYLTSAATVIPEASADAASDEPVFAAATETERHARASNHYALKELWRLEKTEVEDRGLTATPLETNTKGLPCQAVLDAGAKDWKAKPTCEGAWTLYRDAAVKAFAAWDADPAHAGTPSRGETRLPFFAGSPFAKGVAW